MCTKLSYSNNKLSQKRYSIVFIFIKWMGKFSWEYYLIDLSMRNVSTTLFSHFFSGRLAGSVGRPHTWLSSRSQVVGSIATGPTLVCINVFAGCVSFLFHYPKDKQRVKITSGAAGACGRRWFLTMWSLF